MESIHNISEGFLTYDDRKDIDAHLCLVNVIELYRDHIAMHIDVSKEKILEEYKKMYYLEEMNSARVNRPLAADPVAATPPARLASPKNFGERTWRLLNERSAAAASTKDTRIVVVKERQAEAEPPPQPDTFVDTEFYIKLKATVNVIFVFGWDVCIQHYQFNELDNRMSKLKNGQNTNNSVEETAVELSSEMSMDAKLIGKFIML